jgi:hypothetical protein
LPSPLSGLMTASARRSPMPGGPAHTRIMTWLRSARKASARGPKGSRSITSSGLTLRCSSGA